MLVRRASWFPARPYPQIDRAARYVSFHLAKDQEFKDEFQLSANETKSLNKVVKLAEKVGAKTPEELLTKIDDLAKNAPKKNSVHFQNNIKNPQLLRYFNDIVKNISIFSHFS